MSEAGYISAKRHFLADARHSYSPLEELSMIDDAEPSISRLRIEHGLSPSLGRLALLPHSDYEEYPPFARIMDNQRSGLWLRIPPTRAEVMADKYAMLNKMLRAGEPTGPYVMHVRGYVGQYMALIGLHHAGDNPDHENYALLEHEWGQFMHETKDRRRVALYEGRAVRDIPRSKQSALTLGREAPLVAYWAKQAGMPSLPGEPSRREIGRCLLSNFAPEEVYYFYLARQLSQYPRMRKDSRPSMEAYMQQTYDSFYIPLQKWKHLKGGKSQLLGWMALTHEKLFSTQFNPTDADFLLQQIADYTAPAGQSRIQKVATACNALRDIFLVSQYQQYYDAGVSVFDTRGWPHIYAVEDDVRLLGARDNILKLPQIERNRPSLRDYRSYAGG